MLHLCYTESAYSNSKNKNKQSKDGYKVAQNTIKKKLISSRMLRYAAPIFVGACLFGALITAEASPQKVQIVSKSTAPHSATKKITKPATPSVQKPITTPATAPAVAQPAPVIISPPVKHTVTAIATSVPQPVVTPSPSSSVSSLAPTTTPATTPSSSGGSSSPTPAPTPPAMTTGYTSSNWSGYLATSGTYNKISGSWIATSPTGNNSTTTADSSWIGIGGVTTSDLIQIGTQNLVSASGVVTESAFYEILPSASVTVPSVGVSPGDSMSASMIETSPGQWTISITDITNGQTFSDNLSYTSTNSSAEWIEEDPSFSRHRQIPFDFFGQAIFSSASTNAGGSDENLIGSEAQPITMLNSSSLPIATPSAIGTDGASFNVTRNNN